MAAAAAQDDDYNSSDIEVPEAQNPYAHLGRASIISMLANAGEERAESKIKSKQLVDSTGAPGTRQIRASWVNRFKDFAQGVLRHGPGTTPTGEDVERFLFTIVKHLRYQPSMVNDKDNVPSYRVLSVGLVALLRGLRREYGNFYTTKQNTHRFADVLGQLLQEGKITKNPKREAQWLGAIVAAKLSTALFQDALLNGTRNWDVVISRALSIVLMAALVSRSGDIAKSNGYTDVECLKYGHISMKLVEMDGVETIKMLTTIHYEKGHKDTRAYSRKVVVYATTDPNRNTACPVHLVIILAMRVGAVSSVTLDHLFDTARSRNDRTVQWQYPEWPVLAAIDGCSYHLVTAKPATAHQIPVSVQLAAGLAGITENVIPHDLKRGAMQDLANLVTPIRGTATAAVAKAGGHSLNARHHGVTDQYVGHLKQDLWTKRLDEADADNEVVPAIGARPFKKPRTQPLAIDVYCQENALDKNSKKDRTKASSAIWKQERIRWADEARNPSTINDSNSDSILQPLNETTQLSSRLNIPAPAATSARTQSREPSQPTDLSMIDPQLREGTGYDEAPEDNIAIEASTMTIGDMVTGHSNNDNENAADIALLCDPLDEGLAKELTLPPQQFVGFFAQINLARSSRSNGGRIPFPVIGGSRAEPVRFTWPCKNAIHGCEKRSTTPGMIADHERVCPLVSYEAAQEHRRKQAMRTLECTLPDCTKTFPTKEALYLHVRHLHGRAPWIPKPCEHGCDPGKLIPNATSYHQHLSDYHGTYKAQRCPVGGCTHTKIYDKQCSLFNHAQRTHDIKRDAVRKMMVANP